MTKETKRLSPAFLKTIGDYMLVETPLAQADVCIVFGNSHAVHLAEQAAGLYKKGYFKQIVVSGGVAMEDGRLEAHCMRDVLQAKGVPASAILVEDKALNTEQNVLYSRALLEKEKGAGAVRSVLAVGHIHGSRRFLMTLEKRWPEVTKMFTTANCYGVPKDLWHTDRVFRKKVIEEYGKIPSYKERGFVAEIDMEKIKRDIALLPQPSFAPDRSSAHDGPARRLRR